MIAGPRVLKMLFGVGFLRPSGLRVDAAPVFEQEFSGEGFGGGVQASALDAFGQHLYDDEAPGLIGI